MAAGQARRSALHRMESRGRARRAGVRAGLRSTGDRRDARVRQPDPKTRRDCSREKALRSRYRPLRGSRRAGTAPSAMRVRRNRDLDVGADASASCAADASSFAELEAARLLDALRPAASISSRRTGCALPGGREVKVHYDHGKPPWIESRLQDFFGVRRRRASGMTPVVVHLLAPNRRPVQVTTDLAGFWERLYPQVRRELSRRYPKHKWPEKP